MRTPLTSVARELRAQQTEAERRLWQRLRGRQIGRMKFRRQQPVGPYVVDFVCFDRKLVVELDGSQHLDQVETDTTRDAWLRFQGYRVLRFWNSEIFENLDGVLEVIVGQWAARDHENQTHR